MMVVYTRTNFELSATLALSTLGMQAGRAVDSRKPTKLAAKQIWWVGGRPLIKRAAELILVDLVAEQQQIARPTCNTYYQFSCLCLCSVPAWLHVLAAAACMRDEPPDAERIHTGLLAISACIGGGAIEAGILLLHWWLAEGSADESKSIFYRRARRYGVHHPSPGRSTTALCCTVHRCTVRPCIRDLLVSIAKRKRFLQLNAGDVVFARRACLRNGKLQTAVGISTEVKLLSSGRGHPRAPPRAAAGRRAESAGTRTNLLTPSDLVCCERRKRGAACRAPICCMRRRKPF